MDYNTPGICFSYIPFHEDHEFLKTFKPKRKSIYNKPKYLYVEKHIPGLYNPFFIG
jgi:hypothetical protein